MAIPIEGYSVVAQFDRIQRFLDDGSVRAPNATMLSDGHIWKCSFMALDDARKFMKSLEELGLNGSSGPDSDIVIASEFDQTADPYCEWLKMAQWEKAIIGWKVGSRPETVTAKQGWDPKIGSGLVFQDRTLMGDLEFLRLESSVEVFRNKKTGQEVYIGRTSTPVDALFRIAAETIQKHFMNPGQPPLSGAAGSEVGEAVRSLERAVVECPDWWNAQWFLGKGHQALGNHAQSYQAFLAAYRIEKNVEAVMRELAGACLELRRFDEAVEVAQAAVALDPRNSEALGNLAVAFLLAGQLVPARKAIDAAAKIDSNDRINQTIARVVHEVETGRREQPQSLSDLTKPAPSKAWRFLQRLWK